MQRKNYFTHLLIDLLTAAHCPEGDLSLPYIRFLRIVKEMYLPCVRIFT